MTISDMTVMDSAQNTASLISSPVTVQFQDLLTQSALFTVKSSARPNTYPTMSITFSNVVATILNASGAAITVGGTSCASAQIPQSIKPTINQTTTTINSGAFPLTVTDVPFTLDVDVNISASLQGNLSLTPVVSVSAPAPANGSLASFNSNGQITSVSSSGFTMIDAATGNSLNIDASKQSDVRQFPGQLEQLHHSEYRCLSGDQPKH